MRSETPDAFKAVCSMFHQDALRNFTTWENVIAPAIGTLDRSQMIVVKDYLNELLTGKYGVDELTDLWNRTPAQITIFNGSDESVKESGIVYFLELMRSMVERRLAEEAARS